MKVLPIILIVAIGIAMAACQPTNNRNLNTAPFIGGSEGLTMDFAGGAPPDEVYDSGQMPFGIQVILENVGEFDVNANETIVRLIGMDPSVFDSTDNEIKVDGIDQDLRGAAKLVDGTEVPGDITTVVFPATERTDAAFRYLPSLYGTDEITIRAELCYDYKTKSTTQICIKDKTLQNINNDKICSVNEEKIPQNSGSPIHITALREIPQGKTGIQVTFKVEHVGKGLFFDIDAPVTQNNPKCDDSLQNRYQNIVKVHVHFEGIAGYTPPEINCPGFTSLGPAGAEGKITMFQGQPREVSCTIKGDSSKNRIYQAALRVDVTYSYLTYVEKPIILRHVTI